MNNYCLFYGSLKSGHYNFGRFAGQTLIKSVELEGFELFDLGPYPAACVGEGKIQCELQTVSDDAMRNIQRMEAGAGYKEMQIKLDNDITASIFVMNKERLVGYKAQKIEDGNWAG